MDPWTDGETDPSEQFLIDLLAAYGPDWPTRFPQDIQFDTNAQPIEWAPPCGEVTVVRKVFLRLPLSADTQFKQLGRRSGRTPSELVSTWIAERLDAERPDHTGTESSERDQ
ncbi:hypothetical protein IU479_35230 [Nocardia abscessus]|uniref:hypothetical protein n=1 Tax=Nocardia abscessus TaxID=120957 RepID=UPI0018942186|nr:hypothetical protein [Nocardia abscessus]MBF6223324.1 hypothetical protein [Nocardia abscessus]